MIHAQTGIDTVLLAQGITDAATATARWDTRGGDHATIRIAFAIEEGTDATDLTIVSLLESDDTIVTNFATITANITVGSLAATKEVRYEVDLKGRKRWLRLTVSSGTASDNNISFAAIGTLTRNAIEPASTTAMGDDIVRIV
jgi:hypothetical protein